MRLETSGLRVGYGPTEVLHGIDLTVADGTVACVLGPNGAGKSTLLNTIAGSLRPRRGSVRIDSAAVAHYSSVALARRRVALVPEGRRLFARLTVEQNLLIGGHLRRDQRRLRADVEEFFAEWPVIARRRHGAAGNLSGGEQQVVALGRALMSRPRLLLLDEPSLGLAPVLVQQVYRAIKAVAEAGMTIVLVEQNAAQALGVSDTAHVLVGGEITWRGAASSTTAEQIAARFFSADPDAIEAGGAS
jgi:branched-chain amino acid transport system ATP-binding protein